MEIPSTMEEQVKTVRDMDISYRVLHPGAIIHIDEKNYNINVPFSSIINKYKDFLNGIIIDLPLSEDEQEFYQYKPKALSEYLYNTPEFWSELLELNNSYSVIEFKPKVAKVYDPDRLKRYLNEIIVIEERLGNIDYN